MNAIPDEIIERAIDILGTEGLSDEEIEEKVASLVSDPMDARRLIDWIPEAFGAHVIAHLGKPVLPAFFSARNAKGRYITFPIDHEPIYAVAQGMAARMRDEGIRDQVLAIAARSSIFQAAQKAILAGVSIDGAVCSGPALVGIPAEVYPAPKRTFLERLFSTYWPR